MQPGLVGRVLLNQYRVDELIASGGMGDVYRVLDLELRCWLAMKVLKPNLIHDPASLDHFKNEAKVLANISHPNIVPFYGFHHTEGIYFFLQRFIHGQSLKTIIDEKAGKPFAFEEVLHYLGPICRALNAAHVKGIIHCDVKPGNILIEQEHKGNIYLADFGIAGASGYPSREYMGAGSVSYMSPEQIRGGQIKSQTDIYALGVILYVMLTGSRPFDGSRSSISGGIREKIMWEHVSLDPMPLRLSNPWISSELEQIVLRCLEKEPQNRYPTTLALFEALTRAIPESPSPPIPDDEKKKPETDHKIQRTKSAMIFIGLVGIAMIILFLVAGLGRNRTSYTPGFISIPAQATTRQPAPTRTIQITRPAVNTATFRAPSKTTPAPGPISVDLMSCMIVQLGGLNKIEECVVRIIVQPDGNLRIDLQWHAQLEGSNEVRIHPDKSAKMHLTDDLGNRYDHIAGGDFAIVTFSLSNGASKSGWYLFPPLHTHAKYIVFHDDDNGVETPQISRFWP